MRRLDLECAQAAADLGGKLGKKDEKLIADAGSVLAAQGLYAFGVYLRARGKKEPNAAELLRRCGKLVNFLGPTGSVAEPSDEQTVALVRKIAEDLQKLLLAKKLITEMLTYLKYHVKSKPDEQKKATKTPAAAPSAAGKGAGA